MSQGSQGKPWKDAHAMEHAVGPAEADNATSVSEPAGDTMWPYSNVMAIMESNDSSVWAHQMTHPTWMAPAYDFLPPSAGGWGSLFDWGHVPMHWMAVDH